MKKLYKIRLIILLIATSLATFVLNAQSTLTISGPTSACVDDVPIYILDPSQTGANYSWSVTAQGNILNTGSSATIQWTQSGNATITVQELDIAGTPVAQGTLNVSITNIPSPHIIASSSVGCTSLDTILKGDVIINIETSPCIKACEYSTVTYSVENVPGAIYNWSVTGAVNYFPSGNTCIVKWGQAGWGDVSVEQEQGPCVVTESICVKILAKPKAIFETMPETSQDLISVCLNSTVLFIDQSLSLDDLPITSWLWDFGDGTVLSTGLGTPGSPIEHSYDQPGAYEVILVVTNACGCSDSFKIKVEVGDKEGVKIDCPRVVCEEDIIRYNVSHPTCNEAFWSVSGGHMIGQDSHSAEVRWDEIDEFGFGYLTYNNECGDCPENTTVKVPVIQQNGTIQGPTNVCPYKKYLFSLPQWPSTEFHWDIAGNGTLIATDQPNVISVYSESDGSFDISVRYCNTLLNCDGMATLHVTVSPEAFIIGESVSCINQTHTYSVSNASSATWKLTTPSGSLTSYYGQATLSPTFTQPGTYTLEIQGNFCSPDPFQITVHPKPSTPLEILGPDFACVGVPIQYSASPHIEGTTFQWSAMSGTASPEIGSTTSITYNSIPASLSVVRVTSDQAQCASEPLTQEISSGVPSSIAITTDAPNDLTICGSTQWHFDVDYTDGDLYQWEILDPSMGSIVSGNYSPNVEVLFNNPLATDESVQVNVNVTKCNEIIQGTLTILVKGAPTYTITPGATTICANEPLDFTISPTPLDYTDLNWDFDDGNVSSEISPTHMYSNAGNIAEYIPVVTIVKPDGCLYTAVLQAGPITVKPAPVAHISPGHMVGCGPFTETLTATVSTGFGGTTNYEWFGENTNPPNCANCNTWDIDEYGIYYVVVKNSHQCQTTSNSVSIEENCDNCPDPNPQLIASESVLLDCGQVLVNIDYDTNGLYIIDEFWLFPEGATNTGSTTGTNAVAKGDFDEAGIYIFNYNVIYADANDMCIKKFVKLAYVPFIGGMHYSVSCGSGNLYDVTLFDHSNIYPSEQGSIHHTYAYKADNEDWQPIDASWNDLTATIQLPVGNYQLREIIWSEQTTDAPPCTTVVSLNLPDKPLADFQIDAPYIPACINDVVIHLDNQSTPANDLEYLWEFGEGPTNYLQNPDKVYTNASPTTKLITLTATNNKGCVDSKQTTVEIEDNEYWDGNIQPSLQISPTAPQCLGTPITLTYSNNSFQSPPSYTWYQGNTPLTPAVSSPSFDVTQPGSYWVMGSDSYGCLVPSSSVAVNYTQLPTPVIMGNHEHCDNVLFSLTSSINMDQGMVINWERIPGGIMGSGSIIYQVLPAGTYVYVLTVSQNGCEAMSAPYTVTVGNPVDAPDVSFNIIDCQPYTVQLTASHPENGTFNWSNGGNGSTVMAYAGGPYEVTFTSSSGCVSKNSIYVPKSLEEYLWIFPTGCFCKGDLDFDSKGCSRHFHGLHITGPVIPFPVWSYWVNDEFYLTGFGSIPEPFPDFLHNQINLHLENEYCKVTSGEMYFSEECPNFGPQALTGNGNIPVIYGLEKPTNKLNQKLEQDEAMLLLVPNPAAHHAQIQYRFDDNESQKSIEIYDMTGRKIETLIPENSSGSVALSLDGYVAGIYEICLKQDGRLIAQTKLAVTP